MITKDGKTMKPRGPSWRKVNTTRNSACGSACLENLDWSNWWTDGGISGKYGMLQVVHTDMGSVHRVYCRHADNPRLAMRDGILYWLVDTPHKKSLL